MRNASEFAKTFPAGTKFGFSSGELYAIPPGTPLDRAFGIAFGDDGFRLFEEPLPFIWPPAREWPLETLVSALEADAAKTVAFNEAFLEDSKEARV